MVDALSHVLEAVRPGGAVLDLQVIRPNPGIELDGRTISEIDGEPLFAWADAATAAVDARIDAGDLRAEASDDHDIRTRYPDGAALLEDFADSKRRLDEADVPRLREVVTPLVVRERCRLRRLRVTHAGG